MLDRAHEERVERLLERYLLKSEDGATDALDELCVENPDVASELRARAGLLSAVSAELGGSTPRRLGRFELREPIGQGGMGIVYRAFDPSVGREVALKVLKAGQLAQHHQRERFRREIRAVASLRHTNVLPVFEAGEGEGQIYFTMELVYGQSLEDLLAHLVNAVDGARDASTAWSTVVRVDPTGSSASGTESRGANGSQSSQGHARAVAQVGLRVAEALAHAHAAGVIHRDVKPGNVLLADDGRVLLLDFGLASVETDATLTLSTHFIGTPYYAPPERVRGDERDDDPRGDVYSLGATLYELATFTRPFSGRSREQIFRQVLSNDPIAPARLNADIPADLQTIVLRAMEKNPDHRYASAEDLAEDLRRFLDGRPILARAVGRLERLVKWSSREPRLAALAAALVVAGITLFAGNLWYTGRLRTAADALAERELAAASNLYRADISLAAQACDDTDWKLVEELLDAQRPAPGAPDLRAFEWYYLWNRGHEGVEFQDVPFETTRRAAFAPGARRLALADPTGRVILWDREQREVVADVELHAGGSSSLSFSPDGRYLASGGLDGRVVVVDVERGHVVAEFGPFFQVVPALGFSPSSRRLAAAIGHWSVERGEVLVWDTATWQQVAPAIPCQDPRVIAFRDEARIATTSVTSIVNLDIPTGTMTLLAETNLKPKSLSAGPGGMLVASVSARRAAGSGEVIVWDANDRLLARRQFEGIGIGAIAPDGSSYAVGRHSGFPMDRSEGRSGIEILSLPDLATRRFLDGLTYGEGYPAFRSDGRRIFCVERGRIGSWDLEQGTRPREFALPNAKSLSLSTNGERLAGSSNNGLVRVWDTLTGERLHEHEMPTAENTRVHLSATGDRLWAASYDTLVSYGVGDDEPLWSRPLEPRRLGFDVSQDGTAIACTWQTEGGMQHGLVVCDAESGDLLAELDADLSPGGVCFSPDSEWLAFGSVYDGGVFLWDWRAGGAPVRIDSSSGSLTDFAFSPDGAYFAGAGDVVQAWELEGLERVFEHRLGETATAVEILPRERRLVLTTSSGKVSFWDTETWKPVCSFQAHDEYLSGLTVARSARVMATGGFDGRVRVWWAPQ